MDYYVSAAPGEWGEVGWGGGEGRWMGEFDIGLDRMTDKSIFNPRNSHILGFTHQPDQEIYIRIYSRGEMARALSLLGIQASPAKRSRV